MAQYFDGVAGRGSLDDHLHEIFARGYRPGPLHYFLAQLPRTLIVTTNYDRLLETAFEESAKPFHLVIYNTESPTVLYWPHGEEAPQAVAPNELDVTVGETPVIFKMHGAVDPRDGEHDSYVITEDGYVEFLSRLTAKTAIPAGFAEY